MIRIRPPLKWAGSKYRIIEHLRKVLPKGRRLIEPFTGSAAVFLNTNYSHYLLAETNADLIAFYTLLKKEGVTFINYCRDFFQAEANEETCYYERRALFNETNDQYLRAALFLYLNKHGYNGLCRYNQQGKFNVPFGYYVKPYFPETELLAFYQKAQAIDLLQASFEETMSQAEQGDVVYCDPPYTPLSKTAKFTTYYHNPFLEEEHNCLAQAAISLKDKGIPVVISNHDTPKTRELYAGAKKIISFSVSRYIGAKLSTRGSVNELLALF